ncbi:MAG: 2Fe-2S iron-sulfur cluster binding domain-containing protein [Treponema sp.]|nr:2Fe-2S iron-sulfur cluster binding domain-containing protein [Treponema sp.]
MKIQVMLNGETVILDANPSESLLDVLRREGYLSVKKGCSEGRCGSCTLLLDDKPVPSCIIPAAIVRKASIETLEFFSLTKDGQDIIKGFEEAGIKMCGFCNSVRIFSTYALLKRVYRPSQEELEALADSIKCSCTDKKTFMNGVMYATALRHEREGRRNVSF